MRENEHTYEQNLRDSFIEYDSIVGNTKPSKPDMINFFNSDIAIEMIKYHLDTKSNIVIHTDVDVDGLGSCYIARSALIALGANGRIATMINKEKEHGIKQKHVDFLNQYNIDLVIILDSSTNEIEYIKQLNCDVIVVDHHEVLTDSLCGNTSNGKYIIVNNMISNTKKKSYHNIVLPEYEADSNMSCGVVIYELFRLYNNIYGNIKDYESRQLEQWAGVTLITDVISLDNSRNQYYIDKTVNTLNIEPSLNTMKLALNKYQKYLDKSFIGFSLAPALNRAIRAGKSSEALDIVLHRPQDIKELMVYKEYQNDIVKSAIHGAEEYETFVIKDITNTSISKNYCGLIATKLCNEKNKNAAVFIMNNEIAEGSFRGRLNDIDYRQYFQDKIPGIYAQGHKAAFGFKVGLEELKMLMSKLNELELEGVKKIYFSIGDVPQKYKGIYHIDSFEEFRQSGALWKLGMANSKLATTEAINIIALYNWQQPYKKEPKYMMYDIYGFKCMAFEPLVTRYVEIYVEYSEDIRIYVRNKKN